MSGPLQLMLTAKPKNATVGDLLKRESTDIQANEPGTLDWRAFRQEDGIVRFLDVYASSEAFVEHIGRAKASGFLDKLMGSADFTDVVVLGTPTPEAREILNGLGATYAEPMSGFSRLVNKDKPKP